MGFSSGGVADDFISAQNANSLLAWTYDPVVAVSSITPTAAIINMVRIAVPYTTVFTNLIVNIQTAGVTIANAQVGLYSSAGTLLSQSTDQSATFQGTGNKTIALAAAQTVTGGPTVFVWVAVHIGSFATMTIFRGTAANQQVINAGLATAALRSCTQTGHATNNLQTIGNLNPASNATNSSPIWTGVT